MTDFFTIDFTLAELMTLRRKQVRLLEFDKWWVHWGWGRGGAAVSGSFPAFPQIFLGKIIDGESTALVREKWTVA